MTLGQTLVMIPRDVMTEFWAQLRKGGCTITQENWNEQETRTRLIYRILTDGLGWKPDEVREEQSQGRDRLDYYMPSEHPVLIVEAKKATIDFKAIRQHKIYRGRVRSICDTTPSLKAWVEQVSNYCHKWACPLGVITNGWTWIVFVAVRTDGVQPLEGDAIVFSNVFDPNFDIPEFMRLLARNAVLDGVLRAELLKEEPSESAITVLGQFGNSDLPRDRNPIGLAIEPMLRTVFAEVGKDDSLDIVRSCWVPPNRGASPDDEFSSLLIDRSPNYVQNSVNIDSANAKYRFQKMVREVLDRRDWSDILLVIGGVGVGKTMFMRRQFLLPEDAISSTVPFFVDFRFSELDPDKVGEHIYERLYQQILKLEDQVVPESNGEKFDFVSMEGLKALFWPEVSLFRKQWVGPQDHQYERELASELRNHFNNQKRYVIAAMRNLRDRYHLDPVIVLDNADQQDERYQKSVYLFAQHLLSDTRVLVIVCLREQWYWKFKVQPGGPLSAYRDITYHVPAPRMADVIERRLSYAITEVMPKIPPVTYYHNNMEFTAEKLDEYLTVLKKGFSESKEIARLLEAVACGDVRRGLDVFLEFVRSGHTKVEEYLSAIGDKTYTLRFHQVFKSIAFNGYRHYSGHRSLIPNIYDPVINDADGRRYYFTRFYLLNWLAQHAKLSSPPGPGFVRKTECSSILQRFGLNDEAAEDLLTQAVNTRLIEPDVMLISEPKAWAYFRATALTKYLVNDLAGRFAYLEAVMLTTPMTDHSFVAKLASQWTEDGGKPSLSHRIRGIREFLNYLSKAEGLERQRLAQPKFEEMFPAAMPFIEAIAGADMERLRNLPSSIE